MQTKSVLTALSLTILCSTSAFGMMPQFAAAAMRQAARQAGRSSLRSGMPSLPRNGTPRRFLSNTAESAHTQEGLLFKEPWAQQTADQKAITVIVTAVAGPPVAVAGVGIVAISFGFTYEIISGFYEHTLQGSGTALKEVWKERQREKALFKEFKKTRNN